MLSCFLSNLGNKVVYSHWMPSLNHFILLSCLPKWGLAAGVYQWEPTMFYKQKQLVQKTWATKSWKIRPLWDRNLDTRPPQWAWDVISVTCPLDNMHELGSCKRPQKKEKKKRLISSKLHSLNFPNLSHGLLMLKWIKYNIIHELDP